MSKLPKVLIALVFLGIFTFAVLKIPYPNSLTDANLLQLLAFLFSLFLAITFTINIFLSSIYLSIAIALGIIFLLILKALDSLNIVTITLTVLAIGLLISYFRKTKSKSGLTKGSGIPKLGSLHRKRR